MVLGRRRPHRRRRGAANRNALEDAQYAVQLYELCNPEFRKAAGEEEEAEACEVSYDDGGEVEGEAAAWERLAEAYEASRDIEGAIYAYERLLLLEPPSAAALPPAVAAKRSVQELVLLSHRRGLQDARAVGSAVKATAGSAVEAGQGVGEAAVATFTERALADVRGLRRVIEGDLDVLESTIAALADMTADDNEEGEAESREVEEPPPPGSPLTLLARKAKGDVGTLRKIVRNDFNTLELQLLRGDPTLSAARDLLRWPRAARRRPRRSRRTRCRRCSCASSSRRTGRTARCRATRSSCARSSSRRSETPSSSRDSSSRQRTRADATSKRARRRARADHVY